MADLNLRFVLAAYVLTWLCLGGYALASHRRLSHARDEFEQARRTPEGL